MNFQMNIKS